MSLTPGTKLGAYEIVAPLGAGGMGEVYRARDPRLSREVAVKVLPESFLEGEERKQRFEREARLLAALNHPGIAAIYSFEEIPFFLLFFVAPHPRHGARRGRDAGRAPRARRAAGRRDPRRREAGRRRARGRPREGDRPPRPQARERDAPAGRHREGARLRAREVGRGGGHRLGSRPLAFPHDDAGRHGGRRDPRDGRLHEPRAGARETGRQAHGRLVVRLSSSTSASPGARSSGARRSPTSSRRSSSASRTGTRCHPERLRASATCSAAACARTRANVCATSGTRGSSSRTYSRRIRTERMRRRLRAARPRGRGSSSRRRPWRSGSARAVCSAARRSPRRRSCASRSPPRSSRAARASRRTA